MSRKSLYTREMVLDAAVEVFKKEGYEQITVKRIAKELGCSIAPVYSAYTSMEDLKRDVIKKVEDSLESCLLEEKNYSEEQEGLLKRMLQSFAPENEDLQKKFEDLVSTSLQENNGEEENRLHLFHVFMKAMNLMQEMKSNKLTRSEILGLIARHKQYILTLRNKKRRK